MSERAEVVLGAVFAFVLVAFGLVAHHREAVSDAWSGASRGHAGRVVLPGRDEPREGVPPFGPAATGAELAVVAPLDAGASLDDWIVEGIDAVTNGVIVVHLMHGDARLNLEIALAAGGTPLAPASAGPYAIFVTHTFGERARGPIGLSLAESLARVVGANLDAPVPPGLAPLAPAADVGAGEGAP